MTIKFVNDIGVYNGEERPLTSLEIDGNFYDLLLRVIELETGGAFGLDSIEYTGASITFHWSDSTSSGPIMLPVATFRARGVWLNNTEYTYLDIVSVPGVGMFLTMITHTTPVSPAEFDPAAENDSGDLLYLEMFEAVDLEGFMTFFGAFVGLEQYDVGAVITDVTYGTFYTNLLHTAGSTFDPLLEDDSVPVYSQLAGPPFAPVDEIDDTDLDTLTYTVLVTDRGKYLRVFLGCIVSFPEITDMPLNSEIHFEQVGDEDIVFQAEDELVVTIVPQRYGYSTSTPYKGAVVTAKYVDTNTWKLIGPHGDEVSS